MITACAVANAIIKDAKQGSLHTHFQCLELSERFFFQKHHLQVISLRRLSPTQNIQKKLKRLWLGQGRELLNIYSEKSLGGGGCCLVLVKELKKDCHLSQN